MDIFDLILNNVAKHITLEDAEKAYFISLLRPKTVHQKQYILKENQPCNYLNFVNSGTLRAYFLNKEGISYPVAHRILQKCDAVLRINGTSKAMVTTQVGRTRKSVDFKENQIKIDLNGVGAMLLWGDF